MSEVRGIDAMVDARAFERILRDHDDRMRAVAYRMLCNREAMDDALQDAYLKAWRARGSFRGEAAVGTWLHRIVVTTCLDHLRRASRQGLRVVEDLDAGLAVEPVDSSRRLDLAAALAGLRPGARAALLLVDVEGFSYDEVAELLGVAPGTIASRLNRTRAALRLALAETIEEDAR